MKKFIVLLLFLQVAQCCDGEMLYETSEHEDGKVYEKVFGSPPSCEVYSYGDKFTMEYRDIIKSNITEYKTVNEITCNGKNVIIDGKTYAVSTIYIRCVADAIKFCDYERPSIPEKYLNEVGSLELSPPEEYCSADKSVCEMRFLKYETDTFSKFRKYERVKLTQRIMKNETKYPLSCRPNFKIEYRELGNYNWKTLPEGSTLTCMDQHFIISDSRLRFRSFYVRCYAEAKYFCNNNIFVPEGKKGPDFFEPSLDKGLEGFLKCSDNEKFAIVDGKPEFGKFECLNYNGEKLFWTINGIPLRPGAPDIYCNATVDCALIRKFSNNAVRNGYLVNNIPKCGTSSSLKIFNEPVNEIKCDETNGKYIYNTIGEEFKEVPQNVIFVCELPNLSPKHRVVKGTSERVIFVLCFIPFIFALVLLFYCHSVKPRTAQDKINEFGEENTKIAANNANI